MAYPVVRDSPELGPGAKGADRRFPARGEHTAKAKAVDVSELAFHEWRYWGFHAFNFTSTAGWVAQTATGMAEDGIVGKVAVPAVAGRTAFLGRMQKNRSASSGLFRSR